MNWKVRIKNKYFWISFIPAVLLIAQAVLKCFGVEWDFTQIQDNLLNLVNAVFGLLVIIGVVNDPTTAGIRDSKQALTYNKPKC